MRAGFHLTQKHCSSEVASALISCCTTKAHTPQPLYAIITPTVPDTATAAQLQTLPGIGEVIAQRIIDYRESHGPFRSVGELTRVEGIGEKRLEAIWDLVTAGG